LRHAKIEGEDSSIRQCACRNMQLRESSGMDIRANLTEAVCAEADGAKLDTSRIFYGASHGL